MSPAVPENVGSPESIFDMFPGAKAQLIAMLRADGLDAAEVDMHRLEEALTLAASLELDIELSPATKNPGIHNLAIDIYSRSNDQ